MTIPVNPAKSGLQNLYDLVNAASPGKGFSDANVTFGMPSARTADSNPDNTKVTITALSNKGYSGSEERTYMRLNAGVAHGKTGALKVLIAPTDSQQQIRDKIVAAVGCIGADVDVSGNGASSAFKIPENEDDTSCTFTLTAKVNSYVYVGTFTAQLTVPDVDVPLSTAIPNQSLGGFSAG